MNKKLNKIINYLFLIICVLIIIGGFIKPIIKPIIDNKDENRLANQLPKFDIKSFFNKTLQDEYEKAYSDQIPFASRMKTVKKTVDLFSKIKYLYLFDNHYYKYLGEYCLVDDILLNEYRKLEDIKSVLDERINNINYVQSTLKNVDIYLYYVDRFFDINFENNNKSKLYEYIVDNINNVKSSRLKIDNLEEYKKYYYRTDHHWNYVGAYTGYKEIISMIKKDDAIVPIKDTICLDSVFNGSTARAVGGVYYFNEKFCAYDFTLPQHETYINDKKVDSYGEYEKLKNNKPKQIRYGDWYGYDFGVVSFDYHNNKENLLVLSDSFDNAMIELLASHFNRTYTVDLRHYEYDMKEVFNISNFVKKRNIDIVLFLGTNSYFTDEEQLITEVK